MTVYATGKSGALKLSGTEVLKIRQWSLSSNREVLSKTRLNDTAEKYRYGKASHSGSCTAYYYINDYYNTKALEASGLLTATLTTGAVNTGLVFPLELVVDASKSFTFSALISSTSIGSTAGDVVTIGINFVVNGNLTGATGAS